MCLPPDRLILIKIRYSYMELQKSQIMVFFKFIYEAITNNPQMVYPLCSDGGCVNSRTDIGSVNQMKRADQKKRNAIQICKAGSSHFTNE
jgi:hypothetical protein